MEYATFISGLLLWLGGFLIGFAVRDFLSIKEPTQ